MQRKSIFRKASLDRLSSPDELDHLLVITSPQVWLSVIGIWVLLVGVVFWGINGSIPTKVSGQGVLVRAEGVFNVVSSGNGQLVKLRVQPSDQIQANQIVASIAQPELVQKIRNSNEEASSVVQQRDQFLGARAEGLRMHLKILQQQNENLATDLKELHSEADVSREEIQADEDLVTRGVLPRQNLIADRQKLAAIQSRIAQAQTQVTQLTAQRQQEETHLVEAKTEWENKLTDISRARHLMEMDLSRTSEITSPYGGRVLEVKVAPGGMVSIGSPVISIEPGVKKIEVVAYVPASQAKSVRSGMAVEVTPTTVKRAEFGFIRGEVSYVADFPATPAAIMKTLANESLAATLAKTAVTEVRVRLEESGTTASGFRWSSPIGPKSKITSGTLVSLEIVTEKRNPVSLVIPLLRENVGAI